MKRILLAAALFAIAAAAWAQETAWIRGNEVRWVRPAEVTIDGQTFRDSLSDDLLAAAGWVAVAVPDCGPALRVVEFNPPSIRCKTAAEIAAEAEADAEAQAQDDHINAVWEAIKP